jgi:integrase
LEEFAAWYRQSYGEEPEPALLTDKEAREWRTYLTGVKKHAASTVNVKLAALKGLARSCDVRLEVKGVRKVERPIETLSGRELGRLMRVVENHQWGPGWLHLRNAAMVALMARAGLRVGELVALDWRDVVEEFVARDAGVEQRWWIETDPGLEGDLVVVVEVKTALELELDAGG